MSSKKNRSALSGLVAGAQKEKEARQKTPREPAEEPTPNSSPTEVVSEEEPVSSSRESITIYMDRQIYNRVNIWSEFLDGVNKADLLDRAVSKYCDELAAHFNDGQDPPQPQRLPTSDPLP